MNKNEEEDFIEVCEEEEKTESKKGTGPDDIVAMQAVVCILTAILIFGINIAFPDIAEGVYSKLKALTDSSNELFPNPIDRILQFCSDLKQAI